MKNHILNTFIKYMLKEVGNVQIRDLDIEKDFDSFFQVWKEVGWIEGKDNDREAIKYFQEGSHSYVADIDGKVEAYVNSTPGKYQYLDEELELQAITAVMVSRIARKKGIASKITAKAIADQAVKGTHVSCLGMFEQGFYNKLGFGTGSYENVFQIDPGHLQIDKKPATPKRISIEN